MKALFKMDFDCGRMGNLEGVFVADTEDIDYMVNNKISVRFGEVLGKHSDISGYLDKSEIELVTTDEKTIELFERNDLETGYNPLYYNLSISDTETFNEPEDCPIEWSDCAVKEYIDFKRDGAVPEYYKEEYLKWKESKLI